MVSHAGHFKTEWRSVIEATINITVSVLMIPKFGIYGALMGTIAALLYRTNVLILYAYKYLIKVMHFEHIKE